jgi:hypothetical protein
MNLHKAVPLGDDELICATGGFQVVPRADVPADYFVLPEPRRERKPRAPRPQPPEVAVQFRDDALVRTADGWQVVDTRDVPQRRSRRSGGAR